MSSNSRMGVSLQFLKDGLMKLHVPYSYGFAIILLTLIVKAATYPLTKQQVTPNPSECFLQDRLPLILGVFGLLYKSLKSHIHEFITLETAYYRQIFSLCVMIVCARHIHLCVRPVVMINC